MNSRSGNRHLRPDSTGRCATPRHEPRVVVVRATAPYVASVAGQHLVQLTTNLLARQYGVVQELLLDIPSVKLHAGVLSPHGQQDFRALLLDYARSIAGPEIHVNACHSNKTPMCIVNIGPVPPTTETCFKVNVTAEGWRFFASTTKTVPETPGIDPNPHGPYMAACMANAAVFKHLIGREGSTEISASLWSNTHHPWTALPIGISPSERVLPTTYVIGAGAVGAAVGAVLARIPGLTGDLIIIDPQRTDETNRNRLLSMTYETDMPKVEAWRQMFADSGIKVWPYEGAWPDYTADSSRNVPDSIRQVEKKFRYEWVLSCVDKNIYRQAIAAYNPRMVIGGSTHDWTAQAAVYGMQGARECLACNHPVPTVQGIEELTATLRSQTAAQRTHWYDQHDIPERERAAIEEHVSSPRCGSIGDQALTSAHHNGPTDWSVGFVSVAAGVLQSTTYLRCLIEGVDEATREGSELFAWLNSSSVGRSYAQRKRSCPHCSDSAKQKRYKELWEQP